MKAALFVGGWEGHTPTHFADWYRDLLTDNGFEVDVYDTLEPLERPEDLSDLDLITPIWSSARINRSMARRVSGFTFASAMSAVMVWA